MLNRLAPRSFFRSGLCRCPFLQGPARPAGGSTLSCHPHRYIILPAASDKDDCRSAPAFRLPQWLAVCHWLWKGHRYGSALLPANTQAAAGGYTAAGCSPTFRAYPAYAYASKQWPLRGGTSTAACLVQHGSYTV